MNADALLDELNGRLLAVTVRYPQAAPFIRSYQKHVAFALHNPESKRVRVDKLIKKGRIWLHMNMWKHPMFRPEFERMVKLIDDFESRT